VTFQTQKYQSSELDRKRWLIRYLLIAAGLKHDGQWVKIHVKFYQRISSNRLKAAIPLKQQVIYGINVQFIQLCMFEIL
jgi:hypothetical protein